MFSFWFDNATSIKYRSIYPHTGRIQQMAICCKRLDGIPFNTVAWNAFTLHTNNSVVTHVLLNSYSWGHYLVCKLYNFLFVWKHVLRDIYLQADACRHRGTWGGYLSFWQTLGMLRHSLDWTVDYSAQMNTRSYSNLST